jgi:NAD(P)-dependent dehydrogenase (short-subunit alcohol dehydrogenase family)
MGLLGGKLALVTGAGSGLGAVIAEGLARHGARVIATDVSAEAAAQTAEHVVLQGGQAWSQALDVTDRAGIATFVERLEAQHGPLDVLINNAGVSGRARMDEPSVVELWDRIVDVNLQGVFNVTQAFIPSLKRSRGCIVNVASIIAFVSGQSTAGYAAAKGGVRSLTQVLARDLAPHGVRANAVAPGLMLTPMVAARMAAGGCDWYLQRAPMQRGGQPEEIVGPVVFLASDMASYVTGAVVPVDGGFLAA